MLHTHEFTDITSPYFIVFVDVANMLDNRLEAIKQIPDSEVILLTRGASTNVYLAKVKIAGKKVDKVINDTNLSFERIYNKLKADNDNAHKDDNKKDDTKK